MQSCTIAFEGSASVAHCHVAAESREYSPARSQQTDGATLVLATAVPLSTTVSGTLSSAADFAVSNCNTHVPNANDARDSRECSAILQVNVLMECFFFFLMKQIN